jgi:hypothetical protein
LFVAVDTSAPETFWRLLALDPDVAEPLVVVALYEAGLRFVRFGLYNNVAEVGEGEDSS